MNILRKTLAGLVLAAACAAAGFLLFTSIKYYHAYTLIEGRLKPALFALSSNSMNYGTVRSFNAGTKTLEIEVLNRYLSDAAPILLRFSLLPDAFIAYQELVMENGAYTSVSATAPLGAPGLAALVPGVRVKYIVLEKDGSASIIYLVVGDPL